MSVEDIANQTSAMQSENRHRVYLINITEQWAWSTA